MYVMHDYSQDRWEKALHRDHFYAEAPLKGAGNEGRHGSVQLQMRQ